MSSIRRYLVLMLLSVMTLVIFFAATKGYRSSMERATSLFDVQLLSLADTLHTLPLSKQPEAPGPAGELVFQIWQQDRLLLSSTDEAVEPIAPLVEGFAEENFAGQRWRTLARYYSSDNRWLLVAQPLSLRYELAEELILVAVQPLIWSLPILALLISLAVKQGLRPLARLSQALRQKKADDMQSILLTHTPAELEPVVSTINRLLERLDKAFQRERRFASDAAHELRTPLSVLKINAHNLALELGKDSTNMQLLQEGVERMSHVVDQILLLNRTSPDSFSVKFQSLDLAEVCRRTIASLYPQIAARQQQIELKGDLCTLQGEEFSLTILLQNLISNASKYSPPGASICVSVWTERSQVCLTVEDSGPGLADSEYERVFERFYRAGGDRHQSGVSGCGLGLSIVRHIVDLYGGTVRLSRSERLGGLKASLTFPSSQVQAHG
ncbi:ATP-binding protein [Bowmanella dokdonensis]|uniref:histidine kinase n=1 Tax=Bowmanella dokdonensis TaxID=751969 RepID=A0A939DQE1_9ALTE|nr:ATP-binding protein [Bowmanella dokdonensis]MBN7826839.1 two-component sensor histidine kinase [Bowmanella dokdonensis]